jgi:ATP-binding protein involved in chromosome partitioning
MREADTPDPLTAARAALAGVALPEGGALAGSWRLQGLRVADGRATAAIAVAADEAERFAPVRAAAEAALRALPGVAQAFVALTAERAPRAGAAAVATPRPSAPGGPGSAASAPPVVAPPATRPEALAGVAHVVAVASGKGGVGKSTTTVNLALGLRAAGLRVGVLDADIHGPSLPTLLGLNGKPRVAEGRRLAPMEAWGLRAMSIGLLVDPETAMVWRGPMVAAALTQMLTEVAWGALDVLLVDMPPGTGDAQLSLAKGARLSGAVIVSTPQDLALIDARRGVAMFRKVDVPILGVIENMAHFVCDECGKRHAIFGEGGAEAEARRMGAPYLGAVPLTMALRAASDQGRPVAATAPDGPLGRVYREIADRLWAGLTAPARAAEARGA